MNVAHGCQFMASDGIFDIIFGRRGKGRFNLKGVTCSFLRECVNFKVTESMHSVHCPGERENLK